MGTWNILSLAEDRRLPILSAELRKLRVDIAGLSEVRRPGNGEIRSEGYTYYWSGMANGTHLRGVAVAISDRLSAAVVGITTVDERIMCVRMKHTLGFMSLISVYAPTEVCDQEEKEVFYAKLESLLDRCPRRDVLVVLGDFNAVTGTDRAGYEVCVGPHGSGVRNSNSSFFLNLARSRRLRVAGSWYQRSEHHRLTWNSNAGRGVAKKIDPILVRTRWRILQNYMVYWSSSFFAAERRFHIHFSKKVRNIELYFDDS